MIGRNLISVHDTSLVKYRVYNKMCARTRMVNKGVYKKPYVWAVAKSPEKYSGSQPVNNSKLWFYCLDDAVHLIVVWIYPHAHVQCTSYCLFRYPCIHLGRRDFSSLHVTTYILCVFGLGTRKKQYVKTKILCYYFTWSNFNNIWISNQIIHTFKNKIIIFSFL